MKTLIKLLVIIMAIPVVAACPGAAPETTRGERELFSQAPRIAWVVWDQASVEYDGCPYKDHPRYCGSGAQAICCPAESICMLDQNGYSCGKPFRASL